MIVLFCTRVTVVILLATKLSVARGPVARGSIHTWTHVVPVVPYFLYTHLQVQGRSFARYTPPQFFHRGRFMSQQPLLDVQKFSTNQPQTLIHANPKPQAGNREPYTRSYSPNSKDKQCIQQPCCQVALRPETGCRALSLGSAWHTDWQGHFKVKGLGSWVWTFVVGCGIKGHCVEGLACVCVGGRCLWLPS